MLDAIICDNCYNQHGTAHDCVFCQKVASAGTGQKIVYIPLDGIVVAFNDFCTAKSEAGLRYTKRMISIDHCMQGRAQWEHDDGSFCYLGEDDIQVSVNTDHTCCFGLPACKYRGITVNIFIDQAEAALKVCFPTFDINLQQRWKKFSVKKDFFVTMAQTQIHNVFLSLYQSKENITNNFLLLKVMELIIALDSMDKDEFSGEKPYFKRSHVEKVRQVKEYLCENADKRSTIDDLVDRFDIPKSTLKMCFKVMYGMPISEFMMHYRLHHAAKLLRTTDMSITEISLMSGYENPSKFSAAFKRSFAETPLRYRKDNHHMECF